METWTLLHVRNPLTATGNGVIRELTKASGRQLSLTTTETSTLAFAMPGNDPQTGELVPLESDILAFRGERVVNRFRVVSRQMSKDSGVLTASFTCVSYKDLLNAWMFHEDDKRAWPDGPITQPFEGTETDQIAIAWRIIADGQSKPNGGLGITLAGVANPTFKRAPLVGESTENFATSRVAYFDVGQSRRSAIDALAEMTSEVGGGFQWDILPPTGTPNDPGDPYTQMKAYFWAMPGGRNRFRDQVPPRSAMVLDDGGSLASWSHTVTPSEYANVIRFTGAQPTVENFVAASATSTATWLPSHDPTVETGKLVVPEGRWERDLNNSDVTDPAKVSAAAGHAFDKAHNYLPEITASLQRGRWPGPDVLWLGDSVRFIVTEPVRGITPGPHDTNPDDWVIWVDEDVRVESFDINIDEEGAEDVSIALNRLPYSNTRDLRRMFDRVTKLERR